MNKLNPNHPVSMAMDDQWHKVVAIMLKKFGVNDLCLTEADILAPGQDSCVLIQELHDGLHVRLITMEEGRKLARQEGGLPQ